MENIIERMEMQLRLQFPDVLENLNPPATLEQIAVFERAIGQKIPEDIRKIYLWHDGCISAEANIGLEESEKRYLLIDTCRWCGLDEMLAEWEIQQTYHQGQDYFFTQEEDAESWRNAAVLPWITPPVSWLPMGRRWWDLWIYLDLCPGNKGFFGQIIRRWGQGGDKYVAVNIRAYFSTFAEGLEAKRIRYDSENHVWVDKKYDKEVEC